MSLRQRLIKNLVRNFQENGLKFLLEEPRNTAEMLGYAVEWLDDWMDGKQLRLVRTTFVQRDYRHVESDLVFTAPRRRKAGGRLDRNLLVYLLLEHQSQIDPLMPLRLLDYVVQIYKSQLRAWNKEHGSLANVRLQPVLPIVLYTGERDWSEIGQIADLIDWGQPFDDHLPKLRAKLIRLEEFEKGALESRDAMFGWVLRVLQERRANVDQFAQVLRSSTHQLAAKYPVDRIRILELLSYLQALIYHERSDRYEELAQVVEEAVADDPVRKELSFMGMTMAERHIKEGMVKGKEEGMKEGKEEGMKEGMDKGVLVATREILLDILTSRFDIADSIRQVIDETQDINQLKTWTRQAWNVKSVRELKIK